MIEDMNVIVSAVAPTVILCGFLQAYSKNTSFLFLNFDGLVYSSTIFQLYHHHGGQFYMAIVIYQDLESNLKDLMSLV
jgi:hypothetical protein